MQKLKKITIDCLRVVCVQICLYRGMMNTHFKTVKLMGGKEDRTGLQTDLR